MRRFLPVLVLAAACSGPAKPATTTSANADSLLATYTTVRLDADVSKLTDAERKMIPLLIDAAKDIDAIFWLEASGPRDSVLASVADTGLRRYADLNYGP